LSDWRDVTLRAPVVVCEKREKKLEVLIGQHVPRVERGVAIGQQASRPQNTRPL